MQKRLLPVNVLDELEKTIVELIIKKPEITISEISERLNKDRKTVRTRIKKLVKTGVLSGPEFRINPYVFETNYALLNITVEPAKVSVVIEILESLPGVLNILYSYSGRIYTVVSYSSPRKLDNIITRLKESGIENYSIDDNLHVSIPEPYSFRDIIE